MKLVSIIIAAHNAETTIRPCMDSMLAQNYNNIEIFVVNDGSIDSTEKILAAYESDPHVRIIKTAQKGPSAARNTAVLAAKGEYIAFTDSDCIAENNWISELVRVLESSSENTAGAGGIQKSPANDSVFGKLCNEFMANTGFIADYMKGDGKSVVETSHNPTCNVMYKRGVLDKVGRFLEELWPGEDVELDYRIIKAGYKLLYNPGAIVYHYRPGNLKSFARMMSRYGYAQSFLLKKYGIFRKIQYLPFVSTAFLLVFNVFAGNLILCFMLVSFIYFIFKLKSIRKAFMFEVLGFTAFIYWNYGFIKELMSRPKK